MIELRGVGFETIVLEDKNQIYEALGPQAQTFCVDLVAKFFHFLNHDPENVKIAFCNEAYTHVFVYNGDVRCPYVQFLWRSQSTTCAELFRHMETEGFHLCVVKDNKELLFAE